MYHNTCRFVLFKLLFAFLNGGGKCEMRTEYILLPKKSKKSELNSKKIKSILSLCFNNVTNHSFVVKPNRAEYTVSYQISYSSYSNIDSSDKFYSVKFGFEHSRKDRTAEVLNCVNQLLASCYEVSQYHLIIVVDEVSEYYCNKSFPKFQKFERLIRQLIFKIMVKAFGSLWVEKTISEDKRNDLKRIISEHYPDLSKNKVLRDEKIIDEALYHMDIFDLESFLFNDRREIDPMIIIDSELTRDSLESMNKDEIVKVIEKGRLKSLWDRFFSSMIKIDNPKSLIDELRKFRNKVAHSKPYSFADYKLAEELQNQFIQHLEKAIENVEMVKYEPFILSDILSAFSNILVKSFNFSEKLGIISNQAVSQLADIGLTASKMIQDSLKIQSPETSFSNQMAVNLKSFLPDLSITSSISEQLNAQSKLLSNTLLDGITKNQEVVRNAFGTGIDYSHLFRNSALEAIEDQQRISESFAKRLPVYEAMQRLDAGDKEGDKLSKDENDEKVNLDCDDTINTEEDT